jgi:predicted O-methyltransferase YrrM
MRYSSLSDRAGLAMHYDLLALQALQNTYAQFVPWSDSALRPAAIQIAVNEVVLNQRKVTVEFGSGISTLFLAEMLSRGGGRLISIDHDVRWIAELQTRLTPAQRRTVTFIHAPLAPMNYEDVAVDWYHSQTVGEALKEVESIDLVLVDGPPAYQKEFCLNRGPALQHFRPALAPAAAILLDDINRPGEQHIASRWSQSLGKQHRTLTVEAGVALWRLGDGFNTSQ